MTGNIHLDIEFSPAVSEMQIRRKGREFVCLFTRNWTACKRYSSWCNIIKGSWTQQGVRAAKLNQVEVREGWTPKNSLFPPTQPMGSLDMLKEEWILQKEGNAVLYCLDVDENMNHVGTVKYLTCLCIQVYYIWIHLYASVLLKFDKINLYCAFLNVNKQMQVVSVIGSFLTVFTEKFKNIIIS